MLKGAARLKSKRSNKWKGLCPKGFAMLNKSDPPPSAVCQRPEMDRFALAAPVEDGMMFCEDDDDDGC